MVESISTFQSHNNAVSHFTRLQSDLADVSEQISSGRQHKTFTSLGSELTEVVNFESSIKLSNRFISGNDTTIIKLETMDLAIAQMQEIASDIRSQIVLKRASGEALDIANFAKSALDQIADNLNTKNNGASLFAGSKTNQNAVGDLKINVNIIDGKSNASYYQGDNVVFSSKASENLDLEYGIKANEGAFQDLIASLHKAIEFETSELDSDINASGEFIDKAIDGLVTIRSKVNIDLINLRSANAQHDKFQEFLSINLNSITATDIVDATIQSSLIEATLTATLQTFSRISQLTLSDFLR